MLDPAEIDAGHLGEVWRSRLVENGVPTDDLIRTLGGISTYGQWCDAWCATAEERVAEAEAADRRGADLTAAGLWLVAALEFHFAKHVFVHDRERLLDATRRSADSYRQAMGRLPWPGVRFDVPFEGGPLPGVLRMPDPVAGPAPVVVLVPGLDATKEEMHRFGEVFLQRGAATLTVDGPGQGEVEHQLSIEPAWETVGAAVLDALAGDARLDEQRAAIVGVSLGGYYAARAVSADPRWRAGASLGGCHSFAATWQQLPPLTRAAFTVRSGASSEADALRRAEQVTLETAPDGGGDAPFLVVHGSQDKLFDDEQARLLAKHFGPRGELIVEPHGDHVCHNLAYRVRGELADWVGVRLGTAMPA